MLYGLESDTMKVWIFKHFLKNFIRIDFRVF